LPAYSFAAREVGMQVWKRRLVALVAVGAGSVGLMTTSSAGAQTTPPTSIPDFTFPSIPDFTFPTFTVPTFTIPPPTMPPSTTTTLGPPPTMPPSTTTTLGPPPTMPPTTFPPPTIPEIDDVIADFLDELEGTFEEGEAGFEQLQQILQDLRDRFFN
jgi:hypothetical protein